MFAAMQCRLAVYFIAALVILAKPSSTIIIEKGSCTYNRKYISNHSIVVRDHALFVDAHIIKTISGYKAHVEFQQRRKTSNNYQNVFKFSFDFCNMLEAANLSIFKRWYGDIAKSGNYIAHCPVKPGHYYIHNLTLENVERPSFISPGYYRVTVRNFFGKLRAKNEDFISECIVEAIFK